jgi:aspartate racemase
MRTNRNNGRTIGIVGGMGPHAGAVLFNEVLRHTNAALDQEYLSTILMSFPGEIVDRTLYLEGQTPVNPAFPIVQVIRKLETAGAEVIGLACNTAHAPEIYSVVEKELESSGSLVNLVHMPRETVRRIRIDHPGARRIGLMTTNGTSKSGLYRRLLRESGYEVVQPPPDVQDKIIHQMVYDPEFGIKSRCGIVTPEVMTLLGLALHYFKTERTDVIILGCTEFSLLPSLREGAAGGIGVIDSTASLAQALVTEATKYHRLQAAI